MIIDSHFDFVSTQISILIDSQLSLNFNVFIDPSLKSGHFCSNHFTFKFHFDRLLTLSSNFNILINSLFFNQIPIIWLISTFAVEYQILIDLPFFAQISTFWSIWHFALKFQHFDQFPPYCTQMSTFWLIPHFSLKIQHFERFGDEHSNFNILIDSQFCSQFQYPDLFLIFQSNSNILINSHLAIKCQHLINLPFFAQISTFWLMPPCCTQISIFWLILTFFTQISTFWSIPTLLHLNVNFLTDSPLFTQISTFWSNWRLALKFQHFDWFPILSSNFNILIDSLVFKFQQFRPIPTFAIKHKHLLNPFFFAQISTFSLIIAFSLKF